MKTMSSPDQRYHIKEQFLLLSHLQSSDMELEKIIKIYY